MRLLLVALFGLLTLGGCTTQKEKGLDRSSGAAITAMTELPPPDAGNGFERAPAYVVGPFDVLTVNVFGVEELSGDITADGDGRIAVPLAGTIDAANLTQVQLAEVIAARLSPFVKNPSVTVNVKDAKSRTFTVDGQVRDPGVYRALGNMSLMRAVATAKGTTEDADVKDVAIFRKVGNQQLAAIYNLGAIRRGTYADPQIYPNDIIVVGDSPRTRLLREIGPVLATPIVLLLQNLLP